MTKIDKHAAGTPSWFDLMTPDLDKARAFYKSVFGWDYEIGSAETGHYTMAKVDGQAAAGIGSLPPGAPMPSAWTVYFNVDSADTALETIKANGGSVMMGPMDVIDAGRLAVAADPTGAVFGLWQPKRHQGAGIRDVHGTMGWQECHTRDAAKAREFYARTFKFEPVKMEGMDYWTLRRGEQMYGGVMHDDRMPAQVSPYWLAYFSVDDTDRAVTAVKAGGGKVMMEPEDTPYGRLAVVTDPFGATFALVQSPKA